jgi:hypothetical protein
MPLDAMTQRWVERSVTVDPRYQQAINQAYEQGRRQGQQEAGSMNVDLGLREQAAELRREFESKLNRQAGHFRRELAGKDAHIDQKLSELAAIATAIDGSRSGGGGGGGMAQRDEGNIIRPGTIRIEDIPGRRVPYVLAVDIAINNNTTSQREASVTISQEGPFVAVRRMAIFQSAYEFQTTDPESGQVSRFTGRSFGRYRPIHSAGDIMDSQHNAVADTATWFLSAMANPSVVTGTELPNATLGLPSNMSSFRTMEFDGRVEVINAGSSYPRQNIEIPSAFWTKGNNGPWDLGALDFFERGEVITVRTQPLHVNNPPVGNVDSSCIFPVTDNGGTGWPFLDGQYDAHEGICTPDAVTLGDDNPLEVNVLASDAVQRLPDGILTFAWEGYRIIQPVGPAV